MLARAGATHDCVFTTSEGHAGRVCFAIGSGAREVESGTGKMSDGGVLEPVLLANVEVSCILSCSGDGMLHECLNGLISGSKVNPDKSFTPPPLAPIPVGSGNGVACSLFGRGCTPHSAVTRCLEGVASPVDIFAVRLDGGEVIYDLHFFCWSCFADHDYLTEGPLRPWGPIVKMLVAPALVIWNAKVYEGVLDFLPADPKLTPPELLNSGAYTPPEGFEASPLGEGWRRATDGFWCFAVGNLSEAGGGMAATPNAKQSEGAADILMSLRSKFPAGGFSRWRSLMLFLQMEKGEHVVEDDITVVKVKKMRLETKGAGHLQLSGQELKQAKVVELEVVDMGVRVVS